MVYKLMSILMILSLSSCTSYYFIDWIYDANGGRQAKEYEYTLSRSKVCFNNQIDTNAAYIANYSYVTTDYFGNTLEQAHKSYTFIRFSSNGVGYVQSFNRTYPTFQDFISYNQGQFVRYNLCRDGLILEKFNFDTKLFEYQYFEITNNGNLIHYKTKGQVFMGYTRNIFDIYTKVETDALPPLVFPK